MATCCKDGLCPDGHKADSCPSGHRFWVAQGLIPSVPDGGFDFHPLMLGAVLTSPQTRVLRRIWLCSIASGHGSLLCTRLLHFQNRISGSNLATAGGDSAGYPRMKGVIGA